MIERFNDFVKSSRELEIWNDGKMIFESDKKMVGGLLEFIGNGGSRFNNLIIFDKRAGNAVALLCAYLRAKEIYAVIGSEVAKKTLEDFKIKFHFSKTIPNILNKKGNDICPLEKLSFDKSPKEFYDCLSDTKRRQG